MNKNMKLFAIASCFFVSVATAQAEYKIKFEQDKLPLKVVWFKQLTKNLLKPVHFRNLSTVISFKENKKGDINYEGLLIHW